MKAILISISAIMALSAHSQELFSMTEPASNKPSRSISFRVDHSLMDELETAKINYHLIPEIMVGVSKTLMISGNVFISNRTSRLRAEGGSVYAKYRFLSNDRVQRHFSMAVFGRVSYNNSDIHQEEINLYGHNTGVEVGLVATQLLRKVALSSCVSYANAEDNGGGNKFIYGPENRRAVNYTFSVGKLMLPKEYASYKQTNLNLMVEFLSQVITGSGKYFIDIAPSLQFIVNSQSRLDIGYRKEISTSLIRTSPNGFFVRFEHTLFNVL